MDIPKIDPNSLKLVPESEKVLLDQTLDSINSILAKLICPISKKIFQYPVLDENSNVYEMIELINDLKKNGKTIQNIIIIKPLKSFIDSIAQTFPNIEKYRYSYEMKTYDFCENKEFFDLIYNAEMWKFIYNFKNFDLVKLGSEKLKNIIISKNSTTIKHIIDNCQNIQISINDLTIMHYSLYCKNENIVDYLLSKKFDIFDKNFNGKYSYLYYAACYSSSKNVVFFLEKQLNIFEYIQDSHSNIIKFITRRHDFYTNLILLDQLRQDDNIKKFSELKLYKSILYFKENIYYSHQMKQEEKEEIKNLWDDYKQLIC